mgnify:FL=1
MDADEKLIEDIKKLLNDTPEEEDPYEKGFADKLYEDDDEKDLTVKKPEPQPVIRAYNADYHRAPPRDRAGETQQPRRARENATQRYYAVQEPEYRAPQKPRRKAEPQPAAYEEPETPKKKKHGFGKGLAKFLLVVLLIIALLTGVLFLVAKQPVDANCDLARKRGNSTILLAGTDASGDRTDTIMLLNIDRKAGKLSLMSIPRDTKVNSTYTPHKINAAYGVNGSGEQGMDALMEYVSECIGFRPDGYMLIDLNVFVELVDLMGGVRFDVPCDMYYNDPTQDLYINLQAGEQKLNGEQAMGVVRFRSGYAMADLERVNVQRDFLSAALHQWVSVKNLWKLPKALSLLLDHTLTDLSTANLLWMAESVVRCGTGDMMMTTIPHGLNGDGEYVLIDAQETLDLVNESFCPYEQGITMDDLYIAY